MSLLQYRAIEWIPNQYLFTPSGVVKELSCHMCRLMVEKGVLYVTTFGLGMTCRLVSNQDRKNKNLITLHVMHFYLYMLLYARNQDLPDVARS